MTNRKPLFGSDVITLNTKSCFLAFSIHWPVFKAIYDLSQKA